MLEKYPLLKTVEVQLKKPWAPIGLPLDNMLVNVTRGRAVAYLGIGSNIGDKKGYLDFAVKSLEENPYCKVLKVSDYIETKPVGEVELHQFVRTAQKEPLW